MEHSTRWRRTSSAHFRLHQSPQPRHRCADRVRPKHGGIALAITPRSRVRAPDWHNSKRLRVLSKKPVGTLSSGIPVLDDSGLWLEVVVPAHGFTFGVVHVPTKSRTIMKEFLSALVQIASRNVGNPLLLVGDFNTGIGSAAGSMDNFGDVDRFEALHRTGFTDAWRHVHGDCIEYTWCRNGRSYRIDHALAAPGLLSRIRSCRYSHQERIDGISDHSVLLVEIEE